MTYNFLSKMGRRTGLPPISWLMQTALTRPKLVSLAAGFTDNATLPVEISRKLLNEVLRSPTTGQPALQYGITAGEMNLRTLTAKHLQKLDGGHDRAHSPEHVIITGGSQQLLYMTLEALCDEGDIILVEDPTYFVFLSILQSRGIKARGVKLERDGIDLAHLEKVLERLEKSGELRRVKALYLVTYFQNPTGATTSLAKKSATLKLLKKFERAAGHPLYLLEDAAYRELRFDHGADVPTALTLPGAAEHVIYTGTYSKPYAPGARVGFGILPKPVFTTVQRIKGNHDFGTANLLQQLLPGALSSGLYDKHVAKVRKNYARKRLSFYMAKPLADYLESLPSSDQPDACVFPKTAAMAEKHTGTISTKFYDEILAPAGLVKTRPKANAKIGGNGRDAKRQTSELSFHSLRHTFTTWLKSAGASNALAQMIVGHDSEVVSRGYTHLDADDTQAAINRLPDVTKVQIEKGTA